ncbi:hypothetical protein BJP36_12520 [Moorena producens JHB]|uniref:Uncharacterized protein n=2 Tax=Moorena TaxID=1155738 RepID=A0A1D9FZ61_MOOP1|nr:hypothetical protein [Moorena producens]AOY80623.1 hypothetical protein BJP36_12520 [Moorena producens JHB]NEQ12598.1 hypothetical protein [Moorena sp. SIO3E2]
MLTFANPLHYPLAVLAGGVVLAIAVRVARLPSPIAIPLAGVVTVASATVLKQKESQPRPTLQNPALERELQQVRQQAQLIAQKAESLRSESEKLALATTEMELLSTIQFACDRALELPSKIDQFSQRLHGTDSLLSVTDLQQQLQEVEAKQNNSSGVARQQLQQLATSLKHNITLARQGEDARQAQVIALATLITDTAGVLQQLQNRLRTSNLEDTQAVEELRSLSTELAGFQDNMALFLS